MCVYIYIWKLFPTPRDVYISRFRANMARLSVCMTSMYVYLEYIVILILYATIIVLYNILKNMCSFEKKTHSKDLEYLNISMSTYLN